MCLRGIRLYKCRIVYVYNSPLGAHTHKKKKKPNALNRMPCLCRKPSTKMHKTPKLQHLLSSGFRSQTIQVVPLKPEQNKI
jgi:hypothetical protein